MPRSPGNLSDIFPQISPEFAASLGYVAKNWANLESLLAYSIGQMLGLNRRAAVVATTELSSLARIDMISAILFEVRHQDWLDSWNEIKPEIHRLRALRNELIHSTWQVVGDEHMQFYARVRERIAVRNEKMKADDLIEVADQITALADELGKHFYPLFSKIAAELADDFTARPPLTPGQGLAARVQAQAREAKLARKAADRARQSNRPKSASQAKPAPKSAAPKIPPEPAED